MTEYIFVLSSFITLGCLGVSLKPSPIYGGMCLIVSGCSGCLAVLGFGGSFLGAMMFLVYLGGMLVAFGYTTAMSTEEFPETLMSSWSVFGVLVTGTFMEAGVVYASNDYNTVNSALVHNRDTGGWVVYDSDDLGLMGGGGAGTAALYSSSAWLMVVSGWTLLMGVAVIMQIVRMT